MEICVNGRQEQVASGATVAALVTAKGFRPGTVVVEHNEEIVPGEAWAERTLAEGDVVEIVQFMGGGC